MLVGRELEEAQLKRRIAAARRGRGCAVLVRGEAGVGKSALVESVCQSTRGVRLLGARGVESEAELGFALVADLTRPLMDLLGQIPPPQSAALQGALALAEPVPGDRFAVYAAVLSLLAAAAEQSPVIVFVDDAHWVDAPSAEALSFCARRVYAEPIALVMVARAEEPLPFRAEDFEPLSLAGLDEGAAGELLARSTGKDVASSTVAGLCELTAGNPLALLEAVRLLSEEQLSGRVGIGGLLPVGSSVERLFLRRVARLPERTRDALVVAAASDTGAAEEIFAALSSQGLEVADLERAEDTGLIEFAEGRLSFRHPLVRAVVYNAAAQSQRRAAHLALASSLRGPDAPVRRAWHRASGTVAADEEVADELEQAGAAMLARSGFAAAASAFERAAQLTEPGARRARRLLAAAQASLSAGRLERAAGALETALQFREDPLLSADCEYLRATIEIFAGDVLDAHRLLAREAERIAALDRLRAAKLHSAALLPCFMSGDLGRALDTATRACELALGCGGETEMLARAWLGYVLVARGETRPEDPAVLDAMAKAPGLSPSVDAESFWQGAAIVEIWVEQYEHAREVSERRIAGMRAATALTPLPFALSIQSELDFRTGRWDAALAGAAEAVSLARETGQRGVLGYALVTLAEVEAGRGHEHAVYEHTTAALRLAAQTSADSLRTNAGSSCGLLELGLGRPERARDQLAPLVELTERHQLGEPGVVPWQGDWVEANLRAGALDEAAAALARLDTVAERTGRVWAQAAAARCRGILADEPDYEADFERALELHRTTTAPFERARCELRYGERLRRTGQRRRAREHLSEALRTFHQLGAAPWAAQAESELAASGATPRRDGDRAADTPLHELLTPQELQIALIVSTGATNKDAAAALFLSPKTIEFHLGHIYRKLGLRTRTQLARRIASQPTQPPELVHTRG